MRTQRLTVFFGLLLFLACAPSPPQWQDPAALDRIPPHLLSVAPSGQQVPPTTCFTLGFSEPLAAESLEPAGEASLAGVVLLSGRAAQAALEAVSEGALPDEGEGEVIPAAVQLDQDDTAVLLCPLEPLADESEYTLVATRRLCDLARNPLSRGADDPTTDNAAEALTTTYAGPRVVSVSPADGAVEVSPGLRAVVVEFSRPVRFESLTAESFRLVAQGGADLTLAAFDLEQGGVRVSARLPDGRLELGVEHFIRLSTEILDLEAGRALVAPFRSRFTTAAVVDETPPSFVQDPAVEADDVEATLCFATDEPATAAASYGIPGGESAVLVLEDLAVERSLRLAPLEPEQEYEVRLEVADAGGNRAPAVELTFRTGAPRGRPVLTEVMANPEGTADQESGREYLEIFNAGGAPVDLAGFFVDEKNDRSGADPLSPAKGAAGPLELQPGRFAIVVTTAYEDCYDLPADVLLLTVDDGRLGADGLSRTESVELYDADPVGGAEPVSTYGGWISASREGASVERLDPLSPDEAGNWRLRDAGGTPGAPADP